LTDFLAGLRVLEIAQYISGPFCGKLLAALGAEVIKIEKPGEGDGARKIGPFPGDVPHPEKGGMFLYLNTGKKSITLNLKHASGVRVFNELVKDADILIENFEPRVMSSLGLSYKVLEKINPALLMVSISNFGQTGPYRDYQACEINLFALTGQMYISGNEYREPLKYGGFPSQYMAGILGFSSVMAALHERDRTGIGQHLDLSIQECLTSCHYQALDQYQYTGTIMKRAGMQGISPCKDGFVGMNVNAPQWPRLPVLIGAPELLDDPRFQTMNLRREHADELAAYVLPWMIERTKAEIYEAGQEAGLPFGYVATAEDLVKSPQYQSREYFVELEHPFAGKLTYPGLPFRTGNSPIPLKRAPTLGEHNDEIYGRRLKISKEDIGKYSTAGII
jgi:crotonobetainyl-CoA:carnitine CoA-transferase CaiB-like acyl-CoA transferase